MSIFDVIFSANIITAVVIYCLGIVFLLPLFDWLHRKLEHQALQWPWDHIGMPLVRTLLILLFITLAYPELFAVRDAPSINELLAMDDERGMRVVNIIFLLTLLIPLLPVIGSMESLVLPLQGMTASAVLFSWLAEMKNAADVSYFPELMTIIFILVMAMLTHWFALHAASSIGEEIDEKYRVENSASFISKAMILIMQSPVILLYGISLGKQVN